MAGDGAAPGADDGEVIEVPVDGPEPSEHLWPSSHARSTIGPAGEATLGRGWYSAGAARRGPRVTARGVAFVLAAMAVLALAVRWL